MKKTALVVVLAFVAAALFAQRNIPEPVTITGRLALANGHIVVQSGDNVYYVVGIQRLVGFVDSVKEGAQVSLVGHVRTLQNRDAKIMLASKLTIAGNTYDLAPMNTARFSGNPSERRAPDNKPKMHGKQGWSRNAPSCNCRGGSTGGRHGRETNSCCYGKPGERSHHDRGGSNKTRGR